MGRLMNAIPKAFFGNGGNKRLVAKNTGNPEDGIHEKHNKISERTDNTPIIPLKSEEKLLGTSSVEYEIHKQKSNQLPKLDSSTTNYMNNAFETMDLMKGLDTGSENDLKTQIENLKRSFLYEQNNLVENCELEKFELRETYEEDKARLRRAFENEKTELLKEIERKDNMLQDLACLLKEEYERQMEIYKSDVLKELESKTQLLIHLQEKMNNMIGNISSIVENNQFHFHNVKEYKQLQEEQEEYMLLSKSLKNMSRVKSPFECNEQEAVIQTCKQNIKIAKSKALLTRTRSNPETLKNKENHKKEHSKGGLINNTNEAFMEDHIDEIQHELAEVYRKQKIELVKLFNEEKEKDRQQLEKQKETFEREIRTEYDSRMSVERKGWQETIEDLEREIKILKYEREQMDRNYCVGMDEIKTEFEKEKQIIYKRHSDQQLLFECELRQLKEFSGNAATKTPDVVQTDGKYGALGTNE